MGKCTVASILSCDCGSALVNAKQSLDTETIQYGGVWLVLPHSEATYIKGLFETGK